MTFLRDVLYSKTVYIFIYWLSLKNKKNTMVTIEKLEGKFTFKIKGLHKLWSFKSEIIIPENHIIDAYPNEQNLNWMLALRLPGTHIPGLITAGTYIVKDGTIFCDVVNHSNSITIELENEHYKKLIIEVENPQSAIALLKRK